MLHRTPTDVLTLHGVRVLGYADTPRIAARFGLPADVAEEHLLDAQAHGWVIRSSYAGDSGWSLTETGKAKGEQLLAAELDAVGARPVAEQVHQGFLPHNTTVSAACTAWQLAELGIGEATVTIDETIAQLTPAARALADLELRLTAHLDRFTGYHQRFTGALEKARADPVWVTATDRDSCHRVWFELHEDLIATLGLTR